MNMWIRNNVAFIIGVVLVALALTPAYASPINGSEAIYDCIQKERAAWSVIGTAQFAGDKWTYTWTVTQEWDNVLGKNVPITPLHPHLDVPGERLEVKFENNSTFTYGAPLTNENRVVWADNLYSLAAYGMKDIPAPYVAVKRTDGAMYLLRVNGDGTCGVGWPLGYAK